jgi:NAD(P)H-hydrate epimerase
MPVPVITVTQMREWEAATWASGQTESEVIRRVGFALAQAILRRTRTRDTVLVLAGKGHNGADAKAAAEHLAERSVEVFEVGDPAADLPSLVQHLARRPALILDGLFGIGLNRPLSPEWIQFIKCVNEAQAQVLAVDVPSGLNADSGQSEGAAITASVTLTVGAPKIGMLHASAVASVGRLEVADAVGLVPCPHQSELQWTLPADFSAFPPGRASASHKGSYGHAGIVAGSLGFHGAAVLAARAAQRAHPGLITLHTLENVYHPIATQLQAVMVSPWQPHLKLPTNCTSVLAGPGLAAEDIPDGLKTDVRGLWRNSMLPIVVDASALDWLPTGQIPTSAPRVITPHPGEAARLLGVTPQRVQANRLDALRQLSRRFANAWVVLKGHQTLIGQGSGEVFVNSSGNAHLAQGGSGDALGGFLAGLLAQPVLRNDLAKTIRYAVWQHGATADLLQSTRPNWVVEELVESLGLAQSA